MSGVEARGPVMQVAVLVGGRGTRLGTLTAATPKPLLHVGGRPFLLWLLEEVARYGIPRITLLAGFEARQFAAYDGLRLRDSRIDVLAEPRPLGTGGALRWARERLAPRFLLLNGDTLFDVNLLGFAQRHPNAALGSLALRSAAAGDRYDTVRLAPDGRVTGFVPREAGQGGPINGGIYLLDHGITDRIPDGPSSLEKDIFPVLAAEGRLHGVLHDGDFLDIGVPEDFALAQTRIPEMVRRPAAFLRLEGVLTAQDGAGCRELRADAAEALAALNDAGFLVFVLHTIPPDACAGAGGAGLQAWMSERLAAWGAHVDAVASVPAGAGGLGVAIHRLRAGWPIREAGSFLVSAEGRDLRAAAALGITVHAFRAEAGLRMLRSWIRAASRG